MEIKAGRMISLGYGKFWRSDAIVGLMPIEEERGPATLGLRGHWRAMVTLDLERRRLFAEPDVPDRTEEDWRAILNPLLEGIDESAPEPNTSACSTLSVAVSAFNA